MKKEARKFLDDLKFNRDYWLNVAKESGYDTEQTLNGFIHSLLAYFDGCSVENTILLFKTDDYGEVGECINDEDELHENWYR